MVLFASGLLAMVILLFAAIHLTTFGAEPGTLGARLHWWLSLSRDGSIAETVNHGVAFFAFALFLLAFVEMRSPALLFLTAMLAIVWIDDSHRYHERMGALLAERYEWLSFVPDVGPQHVGEIGAWMIAGMVVAPLLGLALWRRPPGDLGVLALAIGLFAVLAFFGVVLDFVHVLTGSRLDPAISVLEDGGEMLAVGGVAILALTLSREGRAYFAEMERQAARREGPPEPVAAVPLSTGRS